MRRREKRLTLGKFTEERRPNHDPAETIEPNRELRQPGTNAMVASFFLGRGNSIPRSYGPTLRLRRSFFGSARPRHFDWPNVSCPGLSKPKSEERIFVLRPPARRAAT